MTLPMGISTDFPAMFVPADDWMKRDPSKTDGYHVPGLIRITMDDDRSAWVQMSSASTYLAKMSLSGTMMYSVPSLVMAVPPYFL